MAWTPPSSDVGDVFIYIAANSNTQTDVPDKGHVYTAQYTLNATSSGAPKPTISSAQVAAAFNAKASAASGTWIEIFGSNLAAATREWGGPDFNGANAPVSLNGVRVTVNGKSAFEGPAKSSLKFLMKYLDEHRDPGMAFVGEVVVPASDGK